MVQAPSVICGCYITTLAIAGIVFLVHLGSIISHAIANSKDYIDDYARQYYEKYGDYGYILLPAGWAALMLSFIALILWVIAYPVAYCAAQMYLLACGVRSGGIIGWMIAAWIIYGLNTLSGIILIITAIVVSADDDDEMDVPIRWNVALFIWALIGFSLMLTYVELARCKNMMGMAPVLHLYPQVPTAPLVEPAKQYVKETVEDIHNPNGSMVTKTTKMMTFPDGSKMVEITEVPLEG